MKNHARKRSRTSRRVLPGFGLSMGITVTYLTLLVLIPLSAVFIRSSGMGWEEFWSAVTGRQVMASYKVTFGISFLAAATNAVFGFIVAWILTRYRFPGRRIFDALVDLPFALPTAVAGIALTALYARNGWLGQFFYPLGIETAYSQVGIFIALTFIGLPFVVRTLQPVLEDLDTEVEEAGASLGAGRAQVFLQIILPALLPALLTGFALAFARATSDWMGHLQARGLVSDWRLMRRKFGLASGPHSDFLLEISLPNLAGLDTAFAALSHSDDEASRCYDRMHGMIARADVGLYRPFPDASPRERIALI